MTLAARRICNILLTLLPFGLSVWTEDFLVRKRLLYFEGHVFHTGMSSEPGCLAQLSCVVVRGVAEMAER